MRNLKALAFAALASTLLAGSLQAQTGTGMFRWVGTNGVWAGYNWTAGGSHAAGSANVYTSPYLAKFAVGSGPTWVLPPAGTYAPPAATAWGPTVDIFCVDFFHTATQGDYAVNFTNLGDANVGSYLGSVTRETSLVKYLAAAYLAERIGAVGIATGAAKDMNGAIWQIMTGSANLFNRIGGPVGGVANYVSEAYGDGATTGGWTTVNASQWVVVSDQRGVSQEYITHVTPEPATLLLLGTGLLAMLMGAGALRRSPV